MSINTIFIILSLLIVIALVSYLIAVKKGKSQSPLGTISAKPSEPDKEEDKDEL